ncbi:MAG: family 20 glycosylhydrolase [Limisphaerales bacterium]
MSKTRNSGGSGIEPRHIKNLQAVIMKRLLFFSLFGAVFSPFFAKANDPLDKVMPVRGFCIAAPRPAEVERFIQFVDTELAPRGVNTLVLRVDYNYQFQSHPELRDGGALSRDDVKKLVAVCRKDKIHLIPQINLLGHQSFGSHLGSLLKHYPQFDETPWVAMPEDYKWPNPDRLYCKSYCPLHPQVHEVVFAVMDELCDVFETDAFHAGMDEVFYIGESKCPRCGGKDKAALFAGEVNALYYHLQEKGRRLWIWSDRLLDGKANDLGEWEASANGTARAIDLIPKDVMLCDWHYEKDVPTAPYLAMKGFHVVSCPWKAGDVAVEQARDMAQWREHSSGELRGRFDGVMQTVWSGAGSFLDKDLHSAPEATNSWNCFTAMFGQIKAMRQEAK